MQIWLWLRTVAPTHAVQQPAKVQQPLARLAEALRLAQVQDAAALQVGLARRRQQAGRRVVPTQLDLSEQAVALARAAAVDLVGLDAVLRSKEPIRERLVEEREPSALARRGREDLDRLQCLLDALLVVFEAGLAAQHREHLKNRFSVFELFDAKLLLQVVASQLRLLRLCVSVAPQGRAVATQTSICHWVFK